MPGSELTGRRLYGISIGNHIVRSLMFVEIVIGVAGLDLGNQLPGAFGCWGATVLRPGVSPKGPLL